MPNKWTFKIKPIKELLNRYVKEGKDWIDPFAGENSPAEITNDLNPKKKTTYHLHALDFANKIDGLFKGVLFDPPYNLSQIKECYKNIGAKFENNEQLDASFGKVKTALKDKIKPGGYAISCGWNSNGFGKNRGFEIVEILLVPHGGHHYDTIIVVEKKINHTLTGGVFTQAPQDKTDIQPPNK